MDSTTELLVGFTTGRRKGGTLKKLKKSQSDRVDNTANNSNGKTKLMSLDELFGKQAPGGFGSPVIDMGSSFTSGGSVDGLHFDSDNPIFVPVDDDGHEVIEEEDEDFEKPYRTGRGTGASQTRPKRWTLTSLASFLRRSNETL